MKYLYFIAFAVIYGLVQLLEQLQAVPYNWLSFYLTDVCAMPLVLGVLLLILLNVQNRYTRLPIWFIVGMTIYWSLYFEYYLPINNSQHTGDVIDVVMYFAGSSTFVIWQMKYLPSTFIKKQIQQT